MANLKISQLPSTTTTTTDDYFVKNNSTETTTNKVKVVDTIGLTKGSGTNSIKSASFLSSTPATSTGNGSVAIGNDAEANADYTTAVGERAECFDSVRVNSTALGAFNRVAQYSTAVGNSNTAVGAQSTAVGSGNGASGGSDVAIGDSNQTQGQYSIAVGYSNLVQGFKSGAIGYDNAVGYEGAYVIGNTLAAIYQNTLHNSGHHTYGNRSLRVTTATPAGAQVISFNASSKHLIPLTASNATLNMGNCRDGGSYKVLFNNAGTFNITSVVASLEGGVGLTILFDTGTQKPLKHNGYTQWSIEVYGTDMFITQTEF